MRCPDCHGTGKKRTEPIEPLLGTGGEMAGWRFAFIYPCPSCNGNGWAHCCDGDRACETAPPDVSSEDDQS